MNDRAGFRRCTSVDGTVTGEHADVQVCDDPIKPQDVSKTSLTNCLEWWNETMPSRLVDFQKSARVIIMQQHRIANVLDKLPKRLQPKAKEMVHAIMYADTRAIANDAIAAFEREFALKHERSVVSLKKNIDRLLSFFNFPAEHWVHLRTTNPIESTFATVRLRQRITKGAGTRKKALLMAYKLLDMAQSRWRRLNAPHRLVQVLDEVKFVDGIEIKYEEKVAA